MSIRLWLTLAILFGSIQAGARPLPSPEQQKLNHMQWMTYTRAANSYDYSGIVRLSNCSGSLVRFPNSLDTDRAMVLTNGHCIGRFPEAGEGIVGVERRVSFGLLSPDGEDIGTVRSDLLMYATMTRTDMALYRLTTTFAEIKSRYGIDALVMREQTADVGTPIQVISGYWRVGFTCKIDAIVYELKEGEWTSEQSIRYTEPGCEVYGGTSGSPILAADRSVIGVNNTGNEDGGRCTDNNPCEVDKDGNVEYEQGRSYGQQINWIFGCLNDQREIDVNKDSCLLPH